MNSNSFWNKYFESIDLGLQLSFKNDEEFKVSYTLPENFNVWCKGNINNAKYLLCSIIREILFQNQTSFLLNVNLGNGNLPIDLNGVGDFKSGAKKLIQDASLYIEHLNDLDSKCLPGILVTNNELNNTDINPIIFSISEDLNTITVNSKVELRELSLGLIENVINTINPTFLEFPSELKDIAKEIYRTQKEEFEFRKEIISKCWNAVFDYNLDFDKNYYSNGGDSIQAIRFIAKLRSEGWTGEFGELLSAPNILSWKIKQNISKNNYQKLEINKSYDLSDMQQKIWNQSVAFGKGIYHEQFLFELDKIPNIPQIKNAFDEIWLTYPQLRVKIELENNTWKQSIIDSASDFRVIENATSLESILKNDIEEGFENQLMRCIFFIFNEKNYLLWSHHHVLLDGWSVGLLIHEFISLLDGNLSKKQDINYQYLYVNREQENLIKKINPDWNLFFNNHEAQFFSKKGIRSNNYDSFITENNFSKINEFCVQNDCTPQQIFLTAFSITNYSLSGKSKCYVHGISSGRTIIPEFAENAVGLFIKNIISGWNWDASQSISEIINQVKKGQIFAIENEHIDSDYLNQFQNEIPEVLLVFENYPYNKIDGKNTSGKLIYNQEITGYPFTLLIMPEHEKTQFKVIYDNGLFNEEFVKFIIDRIVFYIDNILQNPNRTIRDIFKIEQTQTVSSESPEWTYIIDKQLKINGFQKIINGKNNKELSYNEIISFKNKVHSTLKDLKRNSRIALYGTKNEYTPALIYSIMKNGYTYVPINPAWPIDRINIVLENSDCKAIIFSEEIINIENETIQNIHLDQILSSNTYEEDIKINPESEAYILYTSGSTGEPKGVILTHKNLSSFLDACSKEIDLDTFDCLFSITNLGFDLSLFENLFGLYSNKTTIIIPEIENIEYCLTNYPGGLFNSVPSVINNLQKNEVQNLKVIHTAGEPFSEQLWIKLKNLNPDLKIINWYGPTETTTYSTCIDLTYEYSTSVGKALSNENISVRDYLFNQLPDGIEGEIVIGGNGVAKGYINKEDGKFIFNNGFNYYKTGDRGIIQNNQLYLQGRNDRQVKRLGQRFELSEIELGIIGTFKEIKRIIYINHNGKFVLFIEGNNIDINEIETYLKSKFPAYMRPDETIILAEFPENANGKINSSELIEKHINTLKSVFFSENNSELLNRLRQIEMFSTLNGEYSFIEQGGDSIIGLRLIGKLKSWGYESEINDLLNAKTLNDFLNKLNLSINLNSNSNQTDLTPIQQWFLKDYAGNKNHYNQSVLLEVLLPIDSSVLLNAINNTLKNFDLLSKSYLNSWIEATPPTCNYFLCENEADVTKICSEIQVSFDLLKGPVAGAAVFELNEKKLFFISIHHFYCDGYSWRLILDEIQQVLQSNGKIHYSNQVFGKVYQRFLDLSKETISIDFEYYGEEILNPFQNWKAAEYKNSSYEEWEWSITDTKWFQFGDQIGKSTNEKFLYLFIKTWYSLGLPETSYFFETHGRSYNGIPEITESIGWFTQFYPVYTSRKPDIENLITDISNELKSLPNKGLTYMSMQNWKKPPFPVLLNFLGNFDEENSTIVKSSKISQGEMTDENNPMLSFVELNAMIFEGKLKWMLRSHPDFDISNFKELFNQIAFDIMNEKKSSNIVSDQIDLDDLDAINNLLEGI